MKLTREKTSNKPNDMSGVRCQMLYVFHVNKHTCLPTSQAFDMKFLAGENSAIGSLERPARKITWS